MPNPSHVRTKNSICRKSSTGGQELDASFTFQARSLSSEYLNDSHSRVLTRHWLYSSGKPAARVRHSIAIIRWPGMEGMGWDDPLELPGIKAAHVIGGCRES